jgi:parallel beta-helix repeat protein
MDCGMNAGVDSDSSGAWGCRGNSDGANGSTIDFGTIESPLPLEVHRMSQRQNLAGRPPKKSTRNQRRVEAKSKSKLSLTQLEDRTVPTAFYTAPIPSYTVTNDVGPAGYSAGDTVTWNGPTTVAGLTVGTTAFNTIQGAVNASSNGDTVNVAAGTYAEMVTVNKDITLLGAKGGIDARTRSGAESVVTGNAGSTSFYVTSSGVTLDGFTIQGATNPNLFGAAVYLAPGTSGSQVSNNIVQNNLIGLYLENASAITPTLVQQNLFRNNNVVGPGAGTDIYADEFTTGGNLQNVQIQNNAFTNTSFDLNHWAIGLSNTGATAFTNVSIANNTITNSGRGFYFYGTQGATLSGNSISGATRYAIGLFGNNGSAVNSGFSITGNTLSNDTEGIYLADDTPGTALTGTPTLTGNSFTTAGGQYAIFNDSTTAVTATANTFNGVLASAATLTQQFAISDAIVDGVDLAGRGLVRTKAGNVYVTPNSFFADGTQVNNPTTTPSIQRGVDAASTGDTVNVAAGTYSELVVVTKTVTIKGAQTGVDARSRGAVPESIVSNGDGDFQIEANNVTIDGFKLTGVVNDPSGPPFTGLGAAIWTNPGFSGTNGGHQILNNIIQGNIGGIELDSDGTFATLVQHNLVQNNTAPGAGSGNGIEVNFGLSNATIDGNTFVNNPNGAISVFVGGPTVSITNNVADGQVYVASVTGGSISGNKITNSASGGIVLGGGDSGLSITNNEVNGVAAGFGAFRLRDDGPGANSTLTVNHNIFAAGAGAYGVRPGAGSYSGTLTMTENQISGGLAAIQNDDAALNIDASTNYWGTSNPATVAATLLGAGSSLVDFTPLINNGDTAPGTVGFQSDLSNLTVHTTGPQTGATGRITEGYNVLAATGTIHVLTGSYTETVNLGAGSNKAVTLAAGASPGQVVINGNLTLTSNDTLPIELAGTAAANYDSFAVNGIVTLGNATLTLNLISGYTVPSGQFPTFTIINNDNSDLVNGTFNGKAEGSTITAGGSTFTITYKGGVNSNDVVLIRDIAPTDLAIDNASIAENNAVNDPIGNLSTTDPDVGDSFTYALVGGTGSSGNGSFYITGNTLYANASFNFEAQSSYSIRVRTTDSSGLTFDKILTITIIDVNEAPTDINLSNNTINWFFGPNANVGTLSTVDPDTFPQTFTYALVPGTGSANNGLFNISGNQLRATSTFVLVPGTTYSVRISTTDNGGLSFEKQFNIIAVNVYRAPPVVALSRSTGTINTIEWQDSTGATLWTIPTPAGYGAGLVQAVSDLNGDGYADLFIGSNSGMTNRLGLIDGKTGVELWHTNPFVASFTGGVNVTVGDLDGDGKPEVIVGAGPGGGPNVRAFQQNAGPGFTFSMIRDFYAYTSGFAGGVNVAVADVNRDGFGDIITGTGTGSNDVRVFSKGVSTSMFMDFYAFNPTFNGGVKVGAGDVNGDGYSDIIAAKQTQGSQVRVISGNGPDTSTVTGLTNNAILMDFTTSSQNLGVQLFARDFDRDGKAEIVSLTTQDVSMLVNVYEYTGSLAPTTLQSKTYARLNQTNAPLRIG